MNPLQMAFFASALLFFFGMLTVVVRRTFIGILIGVELLLNGAGLAVVSAGQLTTAGNAEAQAIALMVMGFAAAEATLALAIILIVFRRFGSINVDSVSKLRG